MKSGRCYYRREAFGGVDAFSGEHLVAVEDLKETSHAPHLLVNMFLQILVAYDTRRHVFLLLLSLFCVWIGSLCYCHSLLLLGMC